MEIERKYMIHKLPGDLSGYQYKKIEQGYLCNKPTIRIRKSNNDYILTYKSKIDKEDTLEGSPIVNHEVELPLTEEAYNTLKKKIEGNMVYKTRYLIPLQDGLTAELDIFEKQLLGLVYVEVEFPDEETAHRFTPPSWFSYELSADKRFSNYRLSKISSIKELNLEPFKADSTIK